MASNYPGSLDSFDTIAADKKTSDTVGGRTHRAMHNDLGDAIEAIEAELGTDPSGGSATVKARLDAIGTVGTGSPEGVVTAAPGSTWLQTDATTDVKGWIRWVKATGTGNTGWQAGPEADTGWRDVSAALDSTFLSNRPNAVVHLRRVGQTCEVRFIDSGSPSAASGLIYELPDGFWGTGTHKATATMLNASSFASTTASMTVTSWKGHWLYCQAWSTVPYAGSLTYITTCAWPTSLPGSAA